MSRDTYVPLERTDPDLAAVLAGAPLRSGQWTSLGRLYHWVRGRGRQLVPHHVVNRQTAAGTLTVQYQTKPSGPSIRRLWAGVTRGAVSAPSAFYDFAIEAGSSPPVNTRGFFEPTPFLYLEESGKGSALETLSFTLTPAGGKVLVLESLACYELPRPVLGVGSPDFGVHLDSLFPRRSIYGGYTDQSLSAVASGIASEPGRRIGLASWAGSDCSTTSTSLVDAFDVPIPVVPRKDRGSTLECELWVHARASNGTTSGEFVFSAGASGDTATIALPLLTTSDTWLGPAFIDLGSEDLTSDDGDGGETLRLRVRRTAGAGSVIWRGYDCFEPEV